MTATPVTALSGRHLLGIDDLSPAEITLILDTADAMREVGERAIKKVPALRGRTIVNLFFEPSTRTRTSFEIAEKRLSADTLNLAVSTSSVVKGETLLDTVQQHRGDGARHARDAPRLVGRRHQLARHCRSRSSTPATACTSTPPRRCSMPSPCASTRDASTGSTWPSSATSAQPRRCAPTCSCCARWARRSAWRPPAAHADRRSRRSAPRPAATIEEALEGPTS